MERCNYCTESKNDGRDCPHCKFQYDESYFPYKSDDWDILNLDDDLEWSHLQILYRLHLYDIECLRADIWYDENMAVLIGCMANSEKIARVLNVHNDTVYTDGLNPLVIVNLFQEKYLRGLLE